MEIILENNVVNSNEFWNAMFQIINESYRIEYIVNKGKNYFNCSSSCYDAMKTLDKMKLAGIKSVHKLHICNCEWNETTKHKKYNKRKVGTNEIKYIYSGRFEINIIEDYKKFLLDNNKGMNTCFPFYFNSGNFNLDDLYSKDDLYLFDNIDSYYNINLTDEFDKTKDLDDESKKIILDIYANNKIDMGEIKFISGSDVVIKNNSGFNNDHRGLNHTLIELPFLTKINLGKKFTLKDLIISNSNLKSHKFDYWYELYTGCNVKKNEKSNTVSIELKYDHGS